MSFFVVPCDYNKLKTAQHKHLWAYDDRTATHYCRTCDAFVYPEETPLVPVHWPLASELNLIWETTKNAKRTQTIERDCRVRSSIMSASQTTSENTRNHVEEQSEERLVSTAKLHNWRHDRFNLHYICVSSGTDGTDCPGCGAVVMFADVNAYDKTSQSAAERIIKVQELWERDNYGR